MAHALPIPGVHDQDIGMLAMLPLHLLKQSLQIIFFTYIALVA